MHSADWKAESWKRLCSGEFEFYDAFVIEGLEAVAAAEGEAGAEGDAVDHTREDITEVAAGYTGEAVHSTKLTRRLWAFVLAGKPGLRAAGHDDCARCRGGCGS